MNGLHSWQFGLATAVTFAILYTVRALAVAVFPDGTVEFFNGWFHGLDLQLLRPPAGRPLTVAGFAYGLASAIAVSFAAGSLLAALYNVLSGPAARR